MGQNQYADSFINAMLGWIRWIASRVASMFQSSSSRASSGNALIGWFSDNWITLLISLIVVGVALDWLVWLVRWRPYWLWFHKKRVLLDDDIDLDLNDEELMRRFAPPRENGRPHFKSSRLGRAGRPISDEDALYDEDEYEYDEDDAPDIEDPYWDEDPLSAYEPYAEDEDDDYEPEPRARGWRDQSDDDYEDDERFDQLYEDEDGEPYYEDEDDEYEGGGEDEPDVSFLYGEADESYPVQGYEERSRRGWLAGLRRPKKQEYDDDPFSVDDEAFDDPDDDFFSVISDAPAAPSPEQDADLGDTGFDADDTTVYKSVKPLDIEFADELSPGQPEPTDWRADPVEPPMDALRAESRKSRRARREQRHE